MDFLKIKRIIETDVLVVGGGGAAARAALSAAKLGSNVRMAIKSKWLKSGSTATAFSELLAIAAAIGHADKRDHPEIHHKDTLEAGRGFIDPELVWTLASEAPDRIQDLIDIGVNFDKQNNGKLVQGMSDFATYPRTCRANGVTARHILIALSKEIKKLEVPIDENMMVFKLLTNHNKKLIGALGIDRENGGIVLYKTPSVVLATGGAHQIYKYGVGTPDMTGNGYAMAYELGVPLINMEFVQIGPAVINPSITLLSGPVWKTKPVLLNNQDEPILEKYLPSNILIDDVYNDKVFPFTISTAAFYLDTTIQKELEAKPSPNGGVWCKMRKGSEKVVNEKMPLTKGVLKSKGIDVLNQRFEVALVAQCMNGGALIRNSDGGTDVAGLFIAGETAGGVRGPDRPGGNSLAEGQVFGHRTGTAAAKYASTLRKTSDVLLESRIELDKLSSWLKECKGDKVLEKAVESLKNSMYKNCLVIRNEERLNTVLRDIEEFEDLLESGEFYIDQNNFSKAIDFKHMLITAKSIAMSAKIRKESRSCHYREDYPTKDDSNWIKSVYAIQKNGKMQIGFQTWSSSKIESKDDKTK